MFLPDLIHQQNFAPSLSKFVVDDKARNEGKEEHIGEDES